VIGSTDVNLSKVAEREPSHRKPERLETNYKQRGAEVFNGIPLMLTILLSSRRPGMSSSTLAFLAAALGPLGGAHGQTLPGTPTIAYASLTGVHRSVFIADADGNNARPLLPSASENYNASFSASGDWVVFTSDRGGSADVYRVHLDGSGLERLTDHPAFDDQGALSPDGKSLAFVSTRDGRANIWLLDIRSKTLKNLTKGSSGDFRPAWSPDGTRIAFSSDRDSPHTPANAPRAPFFFPLRTQIYVMARDGTQLRRLTDAAEAAGEPSWSADGKKIVYYESSAAGADIYSIDVATGTREKINDAPGAKSAPHWVAGTGVMWASQGSFSQPNGTPGQPPVGIERASGPAGARGAFRSPSWSTDGKRLVFHRDTAYAWPPFEYRRSRDSRYRVLRTGIFPSFSPRGDRLVENSGALGAGHNSILIVSPNGSKTVLFEDPMRNALAPRWSPHSDRIAFAIGEFLQGLPGRESLTSHLALISASGGPIEELPAAGEHAAFPSWSPDESSLVYVDFDPMHRGLEIFDLKTQRVRQLTTGPDAFPAWSPVGDRIVFASNREGDYEIYTVHPNGEGLTRLTRSPGNDAHPAWSPDGEWIVFASNRTGFKDESVGGETDGMSDGEIFVMRADGTDLRQLTENAFEDGTPAWRPAYQPRLGRQGHEGRASRSR
jgi:TolB protein